MRLLALARSRSPWMLQASGEGRAVEASNPGPVPELEKTREEGLVTREVREAGPVQGLEGPRLSVEGQNSCTGTPRAPFAVSGI